MNRVLRFSKGEVIYTQGSDADLVYFVQYGLVRIIKDRGLVSQSYIGQATEGQIFGEMGVITHSRHSATAVAVTDCILNAVSADDFEAFIRENPAKMVVVLESISRRTRELARKITEASALVEQYEKAQKQGLAPDSHIIDQMRYLASLKTVPDNDRR